MIVVVAFALYGTPSTGNANDETAEVPAEVATPTATVAAPPEAEDIAAPAAPSAEPAVERSETSTPTEEPTPTPSAIPTDVSEPAAEEPTVTEQPESTPEPTLAALGYAPAPEPECKPAPEQAEEVTTGGFIDYDCTMDVQITGEHLDPAAVQLNWRVEADAQNGWQVQLLPPATEPNVDPRWTEITTEPAKFRHKGVIDDVTAQDTGSFAATERLSFGMRLHRFGCGVAADPVKLKITAKAETPDLDDVAIERLSPQPEPFLLNPARAAVPDPIISFGGSLDFGTVGVTAGGPAGSVRTGTVSLTITGLDVACGDWVVTVSAQTLGAGDGSRIPATNLTLTDINDQSLEGGCDLDLGCDIAVVHAPATDVAIVSYTLDITLALPEQPQMGAFGSTLTAWMTST